jgi:hypothetical protein
MKNYALALHTFAFVSAAIILKLPMKKRKIAVVAVDTVKKKAINIIDTIDYNKECRKQ